MEKSKFRKKVLPIMLSLSLAVSTVICGMYAQSIYASEEVILHNPTADAAGQAILHNPVADMDAMCSGQKVTWDCVWFGSYPQTEVKSGDSEYEVLQNAEGWDDNGDAVVNGTKYRRMQKGDATYAASKSGYYDWEDDTTYHYFRYEPVKWRVLKKEGSKAMLLSDMALDERKYNTEYESVTWETSTIRSWLNGYGVDMNQEGINYGSSSFMGSAFTAEEKSAIADTSVVNNDNITIDKIFLLSVSEVYTDAASEYGFVQGRDIYDEARRCKGSNYAKAMGLYSNPAADGNCHWWLRSSGSNRYKAAGVKYNGYVNNIGSSVDNDINGVRVALNLNLTSSNLYTYAGTVCSDGTVNESIEQERIISNPKAVKVTDAQEGQNVKYDCVYFGSYPQTEVKNTDSEYAVLQSSEGWDGNGDAVINGTKYRRMCKSDATFSVGYGWEDDTTYHYFKYEPVKWRVLKTDGNNAMLLSDMVLDDRKYNTEFEYVTWETSTIRSWLNGYGADVNQEGINYSSSNFIDSAFTEKEKASISDTNVINNDSLIYGREGGNDTNDKLFLLSESEIFTKEAKTFGFSPDHFVNDISRRCKCSDYANAMGAYGNPYRRWWLRSPGYNGSISAACTYNYGYIYDCGVIVSIDDGGVRVALNLNLKSSNLYTYAGIVYSDGTVDSTEEPPEKKSQTIKAAKSYKKAYGAKPFKLNVKLTEGNGRLSYTTSDKKTAAVDKNGKVTIKGTGICTITVKSSATDSYKSASAKITITIKPKKNMVTMVKTMGRGSLNVTWKKDTKGTGYELQYSTAKSFSENSAVTINIHKNKTTSYKIRKLLKGKKYYVRVRAYKSVEAKGKIEKLYGDWSTSKQSIKVR